MFHSPASRSNSAHSARAQLAGPNERKGCQSQGASGREITLVAVDRAQQGADGQGVGDGRVVLLLGRRVGRRGDRPPDRARPGRWRWRTGTPARSSARHGARSPVRHGPRCDAGTSRRSGAVTLLTGRVPSHGNTSCSRHRMVLSACPSPHRGACLAYHSRATASRLSASAALAGLTGRARVDAGRQLLAGARRGGRGRP